MEVVAEIKEEESKLKPSTLAELKHCNALIEKNPWNTQAWEGLIVAVMREPREPIENVRDVYERFLAQFPSSGRYWRYYAEHEFSSKNIEQVTAIMQRCLTICPNPELYRFYTNFMLETKYNPVLLTNDHEAIINASQEIKKTFDFALNHVGIDISSNNIWFDYLKFLSIEMISDNTPFTRHQKENTLRNVYRRVLKTPMANLETFWKEYENFEASVNPQKAKENVERAIETYKTASVMFKERASKWEGIYTSLARPPSQSESYEFIQLNKWKELITYEKSNPQSLDAPSLKMMMRYVFNRALQSLRHYPEIWYEYAMYEMGTNDFTMAEEIFKKAIEALPHCNMINFAYADYLQSRGKIDDGIAVYEALVKASPSSLVYVQYQRYARRTKGVDAARAVFKLARSDPSSSYHIFIASALLEFHANKEPAVANKIFELGMKQFSKELKYVLAYLDFLKCTSDDNNMRVLLGRSLENISPEESQPIWDYFLDFEYRLVRGGGDIDEVEKLEKRRIAAAGEAPPSHLLGLAGLRHRYENYGLTPSSDADKSFYEREVPTITTLAPSAIHTSSSLSRKSPAANTNVLRLPKFLQELYALLPSKDKYFGPVPSTDEIFLKFKGMVMPTRPRTEKDRDRVKDEDRRGGVKRKADDSISAERVIDTSPSRNKPDIFQRRQGGAF